MSALIEPVQAKKAISAQTGRDPVRWIRENLFKTWFDGILSVAVVIMGILVMIPAFTWFNQSAQWSVISDNFALLMKGQYPRSETWRLWTCTYLTAFIGGLAWGAFIRLVSRRTWVIVGLTFVVGTAIGVLNGFAMVVLNVSGAVVLMLVSLWIGTRYADKLGKTVIVLLLLYMPLIILIVRGFEEESLLPHVPSNLWGGLLLTLLLAIISMVLSFPLGILLALGRQSKLNVIKSLSVIYIEVIRGVPLITILFMGQLMLPLFLPMNVTIDRIIRATAAMVLFWTAYMAENVRGGLQAIPYGQYEAADAIGLNPFQRTRSIILPQALRAIIPVLVNQFIAIIKGTALVALVGLLDLLGIADSILANPIYLDRQFEVYAFVAVVFWIINYALALGSRRLEKFLGVGTR